MPRKPTRGRCGPVIIPGDLIMAASSPRRHRISWTVTHGAVRMPVLFGMRAEGMERTMRLRNRLIAQGAIAGFLILSVAAVVAAQPAAASVRAAASQTANTTPARGPAGILARGAELANATTGAVMWTRSANTERPMGSITKVMTALVVLRAGDLNRRIKIPKAVIAYVNKFDGSTAGLVPGNVLTAGQLLYAMLIPSGCDAAYALAYSYGPGLGKFVSKMNATAKQLGLTRTHFTDFSGLPNPTEYSTYSTPANLIALGRDAMKFSLFRTIVHLRSYHLSAGGGHRAYTWQTTNLLLGSYPGAIGIKTGSTNAAGFCLLFEAVRGRKALIGIVLHSSAVSATYAASDAIKMLNWGFTH
jgi:serine-type D-Ala-D-Ala carboxypeptidase (penicillin-binding protein 5/6)